MIATGLLCIIYMILVFILLQEELEKQEQYFNILEKKENMEAKMDSIREIKCFMITCKQVR